MTTAVAGRVAAAVAELGEQLRITWHAGEPLATGLDRFSSLIHQFDAEPTASLVTHSVQTNATLINEGWCDLFSEMDIDIGVSIDGPDFLNGSRLDWSGNETFEAAMKGIGHLRRRAIPFAVLVVIRSESLQYASELYRFIQQLGPQIIGINIEETEGGHVARPADDTAVRRFWEALYDAWTASPTVHVREITRALYFMERFARDLPAIDSIDILPSVSSRGDVVFLSPELLDNVPSSVVGNVLLTSFAMLIREARSQQYVQHFLRGVDRCRWNCDYYSFCGGGNASNKYFELGTFDGTETVSCRHRTKCLVDGLLNRLEQETE